MRLSRFGEGPIFPHEETMSGPKIDRLTLTTVCRANFSQIFGLYPDRQGETQAILEKAVAGKTPIEATDHLGVVNRMWPVTDIDVITKLSAAIGPKPIFIADGHHRYETACNYREQVFQSGLLTKEHPANFVLMMCVAMEDPGLIVLPTHRLFEGGPDMTAGELTAALGDCFATRDAGTGPDQARTVWEDVETSGDQGTIGFYARKDDRWTIAALTDTGRRCMAEIAPEHSAEWCGLGVAVLHRLVVEKLLECPKPKPTYVHLIDEVAAGCRSGKYALAAIVVPATVDHVRQISLGGERMPPKSTYFYPKLLSGLVFNPLE
jgi:uncharacterized protein (DUF1015 family)